MAIDKIGLDHLIIPLTHMGGNGLLESWQDDFDVNPALWGTPVTGTGGIALDKTEQPYQKCILTGPANADTARLYSQQVWSAGPTVWGANTFWRRLMMIWSAKFTTVASIENTTFFMGLAPTVAATRATDDLIGFCLTADALNTLTDNGSVETLNAAGAPTLTDWHTYALEVYRGGVVFYVDGVPVQQHVTNLPDYNFRMTFYLPQEAGANGGQLHIGPVTCWNEGIVR